MLLTAEQLKAKPSFPYQDVSVPEFGGEVRLRAWTGEEFDQFGKAIADIKLDGDLYALAVALSAVSESGEKLYDAEAGAAQVKATWLKTSLENAYDVIRRMNKLGKEGVEDALKN
jgi:hypothetical protein